MKISEALNEATDNFKKANIETPRLDAQVLLAHILKIEKFRLITDNDKKLSKVHLLKLRSFSDRRTKGEPVAYITGKKEFYSIDLTITRDVLIPRPETEQLVDLAIYYAKKDDSVLDIGTGSGAIAIAIKKNRPDLIVHACDISNKALNIAKKNAVSILGNNKIFFSNSNLFETYKEKKFDLILANPPYLDVKLKNSFQKELLFEPENALFTENNGMKIIEQIITQADRYLSKNGLLIMEIGYDQASYIRTSFESNYLINILKDYNNLPRIAVAKKKS